MGKGLTVTMVTMYHDMLTNEFKELTSLLESRREEIRQSVTLEVEYDMGVLQLRALIAQQQLKLDELKEKLKNLIGAKHTWETRRIHYSSRVTDEIERRLDREDPMFSKVHNSIQGLKKQIALCSAPKEVQDVFSQIPAMIKELDKGIKALPAPRKPNAKVLKLAGKGGEE